MKHNLTFNDADNLGHILYEMAANFERGGNYSKKKGYYALYIKCSKKEMTALITKATVYKKKQLRQQIAQKQKEVVELCDELANLSVNIGK